MRRTPAILLSAATLALYALTWLLPRSRRAPLSVARQLGSGGSESTPDLWWAVSTAAEGRIPWVCGDCVLDPLDYPDTFCSPVRADRYNSSLFAPTIERLEALEPYAGVPQASVIDLIRVLPRGSTIGVLGDSFMQSVLDAMACELRRLGRPDSAGFIKWDRVLATAGQHDEDSKHQRYNWARSAPNAAIGAPGWFVLTQMYYNEREVEKLLAASDLVIINYGLHYCQPARPGADEACMGQFHRYEAEMVRLFDRLQRFATAEGKVKVAIFQEVSAQHFPGIGDAPNTGDWELRSFFPALAPRPPAPCRCAPTAAGKVPLRTQLVRNLSARFPAVRVLRLHEMLAPRYGWHQQGCRAEGEAKWPGRRRGALGGCDCTHYCHSPNFWRVYWRALVEEVRAAISRRVGSY